MKIRELSSVNDELSGFVVKCTLSLITFLFSTMTQAANPVARDINLSATLGANIVLDIHPYVSDADGINTLTLTTVTPSILIDGPNLAIYFNTNNTSLYKLGNNTFNYTVSDVDKNTASGKITLTLNEGSVTQSSVDSYLHEDTSTTVNLAYYLTSLTKNYTITVTPKVNPIKGALSIDGTNVTYRPNQNAHGEDQATVHYEAVSSTGNKASGDVIINTHIAPVNDAPIAFNFLHTIELGSTDYFIDVSPYVSDVDYPLDTLGIISPSNASVAPDAPLKLIYTPPTSGVASDNITYSVIDSSGATSNTATINITLLASNTTLAAKPALFNVKKSQNFTINLFELNKVPSQYIDSTSFDVAALNPNEAGELTLDGFDLTLHPNPSYTGQATVEYFMYDNNNERTTSATITFEIGTGQPAQAPSATGLTTITKPNSPEESFAKGLDTMCPALSLVTSPSAEESALLSLCTNITTDVTNGNNDLAMQALHAIMPEEVIAQGRSAYSMANQQLGNIGSRLSALRRGLTGVAVSDFSFRIQGKSLPAGVLWEAMPQEVSSSLSNNPRWGGFLSGTVGRGDYDGESDDASFELKTNGITAGADYRYSAKTVYGAAMGYADTDMTMGVGSGDLNAGGITLALYGNYYLRDNFYMDSVLTLSNTHFDMNRNIKFTSSSTSYDSTANGKTNSKLVGLRVGGGYEMASEQGTTLEINAHINALRTQISSYDETGAGAFNLSISEQTLDLYSTSIGVQTSHAFGMRWGVVIPQAQLHWEREFQGDGNSVEGSFVSDSTSTRFSFNTEPLDKSYLHIGLGATFVRPGGRTAFLQYDTTAARQRYSDYRISLGGRMEF